MAGKPTVKIGILSDTHNSDTNTRIALDTLRARGADRLIHCGDLTTPEIVHLFAGWTVTFVLGNMDADWVALGHAAEQIGAARPKLSREIEINGTWIGVTHGADHTLLYQMMLSGKYTYLCHGHTHQRRDESRSAYSVRVINPGALGGSMPQTRSVCLLDLDANTVEFIEFPDLA